MKAAVVREHGSIVFEERPIPTIKENELLIERQKVGNLTIKLAEAEANYLKMRKRCANVETQLLKKK